MLTNKDGNQEISGRTEVVGFGAEKRCIYKERGVWTCGLKVLRRMMKGAGCGVEPVGHGVIKEAVVEFGKVGEVFSGQPRLGELDNCLVPNSISRCQAIDSLFRFN